LSKNGNENFRKGTNIYRVGRGGKNTVGTNMGIGRGGRNTLFFSDLNKAKKWHGFIFSQITTKLQSAYDLAKGGRTCMLSSLMR
jgi:hypothetical protein